MKRILWIFPLLFVCVMAFGAEGDVETKSSTSEMLLKLSSYATEMLLAVFVFLTGLFFKWLKSKAGQQEGLIQAIDSLKAGVEHAYIEAAKDWKAKAADGKLSDEEKSQLRTMAWNKAKEIATGDGAKQLALWGKDVAFAKIREIVDSRKAKDAETITPTTETK